MVAVLVAGFLGHHHLVADNHVINVLVYGLYKILCELTLGSSLGHAATGIRPTYEQPAWWRPLVRSSWAIVPGIAYLIRPTLFAFQDFSGALTAIHMFTELFGTRSIFPWLAGARVVRKADHDSAH